jgi:hypothetical protein
VWALLAIAMPPFHSWLAVAIGVGLIAALEFAPRMSRAPTVPRSSE